MNNQIIIKHSCLADGGNEDETPMNLRFTKKNENFQRRFSGGNVGTMHFQRKYSWPFSPPRRMKINNKGYFYQDKSLVNHLIKRILWAVGLSLIFSYCLILVGHRVAFATSADDYIQQGRAFLAQQTMDGIINANGCFQSALAIEPNNRKANFFFSVTRVFAMMDGNQPYTAGPPIENMQELLDSFGISSEGRDFFDWAADFQRNPAYKYHLSVSGSAWGFIDFERQYDSNNNSEFRLDNRSVTGDGIHSDSGISAILPFATASPPVKYSLLSVGQQWTYTGSSNNYLVQSIARVTSLNETVNVPAGTFTHCAKVEESIIFPAGYIPGQDYYTKFERWFAPGIGPCRVRITYNSGTVRNGRLEFYNFGGDTPPASEYFPLGWGYMWTFSMDNGSSVSWIVNSENQIDGDIILPDNAPTTGAIFTFLSDVFLPEIQGALTNLSVIDNSFNLILTHAEIGNDPNEIDYGDVLVYDSILNLLTAGISILSSYDLDIDLNIFFDAVVDEAVDINEDLLGPYPDFLTLLQDGNTSMAMAKDGMLAAIDSYNAASEFVRNESDNQSNDLIPFDPENILEDGFFQYYVNNIEYSLINREPVKFGSIEETWELTDNLGQKVIMGIGYDLDGNFDDGGFFGVNSCGFLGCGGSVDDFSMIDSNVIIKTSCGVWCPSSAVLKGIMSVDGTQIYSGSYISQSACGGDWSGTFTGIRKDYREDFILINFGEFFDDPIDIRSYLPELVQDPYTGEVLLAKSPKDSFPDPTFSGILPDGASYFDHKIGILSIWGRSGPDEYHSFGLCKVIGIAPWDIGSLTFYDPLYRAYPIDIGQSLTSYYNIGAAYSETSTEILQNGFYHIVLTDKGGKDYGAGKTITVNPIDIVDMSDSQTYPPDGAYVNSTTPTFIWAPVTDEIIYPLYYRIVLTDWRGKVNVYTSERSSATTATIPQGVLKSDNAYLWWVQVFDSQDGPSINNFSSSEKMRFYTGDPGEQLSIDRAFVYSKSFTNNNNVTQFGIKIKGLAPFDIRSMTVTGPNAFSYTFDPNTDYPDEIYFHSENGILPDGVYTFTVTDDRDGSTLTYDRDFYYNQLPVPGNLFSPSDRAYIQTTTPAFKWEAVTDDMASPLYYRVIIYDCDGCAIYKSERYEEATTFTLPSGILKFYDPYGWSVEASDSHLLAEIQNTSASPIRFFYVTEYSHPGNISGQIRSGISGYTSGDTIYVMARDAAGPEGSVLAWDILTDTGTYTLYNLPLDTPVYISARWDKDGNNAYTPGDWTGRYINNPVILSDGNIITNIDITLNREVEATYASGHVQCDSFVSGLGDIYVSAFDGPYPPDAHLIDSASITSPAEQYTLSNLPVNSYVYLFARWDKDGSITRTAPDLIGSYTGNPFLVPAGGQTGIDILIETENNILEQIIPLFQGWNLISYQAR
ncbi:hypothetical protein JXL19_05905, partial [bacterium]|nr:hypothetical protein [bacterium]